MSGENDEIEGVKRNLWRQAGSGIKFANTVEKVNITLMRRNIFRTLLLCTPLLCMLACSSGKESKARESIEIKNGDSTHVVYDENGNLQSSVSMKNGVNNGTYTSYYPNGKVKETGLMEMNKRTSVWKLYSKSGDLEKADVYYADSVIINLDPAEFRFTEESVKKYGFSISLPKAWSTKVDQQGMLLVSSKNCVGLVYCPNITITKDTLAGQSFQDYALETRDAILESLAHAEVITDRVFTINNIPSYQFAYSFEEGTRKLGGVSTLLNASTGVYIVTGLAPNDPPGSFLRYKGFFEEVANSFKVK